MTPPESPASQQPTDMPPQRPTNPASLLITPEPSPTPLGADVASQEAALQNPAVLAAVAALEKELKLEPGHVRVVSVEAMEWPDGCLGVRLPDVLCLQVITPGYRVVLEANGQQYVYHTDLEGNQALLASPRPRL